MSNSEGTPAGNGQVVDGLSPGKRLSQGRLQLGLTQEQVAKELYITLVKIKALESDDYGRLNTDTFIRGYIRSYANLLKMDVLEVLAAYDQLLQDRGLQSESQPGAAAGTATPARPGNGSASTQASSSSKGALQLLLVIAAFFLGLWLISVWFFNHEPDKNYTALSPVVSLYASSSEAASAASSSAVSSSVARSSAASSLAAVDLARAQLPLLPSSSSAKLSSASSAKSRAASLSSLSQAALSSAVASSASAAGSVADSAADKPKSTGLDTISFSFRAECWLEVSDSRGDVLATELQAAGSSLTLVGKAPFDVKLGNAPAVAIQLNSKAIDVIPLLGSNVLTLRVNN